MGLNPDPHPTKMGLNPDPHPTNMGLNPHLTIVGINLALVLHYVYIYEPNYIRFQTVNPEH